MGTRITSKLKIAILFGLALVCCQSISSQVLEQDSVALRALYDAANGDALELENWLVEGVNVGEWEGVTIANKRVIGIALSNKNLDNLSDLSSLDSLKTLILNDNNLNKLIGIENLNALITINLSNNQIQEINDLSNLTRLQSIDINNNQLTILPQFPSDVENLIINIAFNKLPFKELEKIEDVNLPNVSFTYTNQTPEHAIELDAYPIYGSTIRLSIPEAGNSTIYNWVKDNSTIVGELNSTVPYLELDTMDLLDKGVYHCNVSSSTYNLSSYTSVSFELQILGEDEFGGLFIYDQLMIEYDTIANQEYRDSLRNAFDASLIDKCQCGDFLELWQFDSLAFHAIELDSLGIPVYLTDPDEIKKKTRNRARVNEAGFNYPMDLSAYKKSSSSKLRNSKIKKIDNYKYPFTSPPSPPNGKPSLILIDTGLDSLHDWQDVLWINEETDDSLNCLLGDVNGYNFLADTSYTVEQDNGHGTHLAGIITEELYGDYDIMNARVFGDDGYGELFDAVCAIYYGIENEADVYNLSWGYYGAPVGLLENALSKTDALIVSSAGNGINGIGVDISRDSSSHYPASFDLVNMISVAAWDEENNTIAGFSNYSDSLVHLAAPGVDIRPGVDYSTKSGSSQSAAAVSAAALCLKIEHPEWGYEEIKEELLNNVNARFVLSDKTISGGFLGDCQDGQIVSVADIKSDDQTKLKLYPNPFGQTIQMEVLDSKKPKAWTLYNLQGQVVFTEQLNSQSLHTINTEHLNSGIYFLEVVFQNARILKKLVKGESF